MSSAILPPPPVPVTRSAVMRDDDASSGHVAQTGVWIGIGAIAMTFAALTSALIVRASGAPDWRHLELPTLLYINTLVLLGSSVTLEVGRRRQTSFGLSLTTTLGVLFIIGQVLAWRQLITQQHVLSSGPSSAFFYVFTMLHALHVLGGMGGLVYVHGRMRAHVAARAAYGAAALYWHFMALLWLYLLVLLMIRG